MTSHINSPALEIIVRELCNELDRQRDHIALLIIAELSSRGQLVLVLHTPCLNGNKLVNHPRLPFLQQLVPAAFNLAPPLPPGNPNIGIHPAF
jgi:hypothetical protein